MRNLNWQNFFFVKIFFQWNFFGQNICWQNFFLPKFFLAKKFFCRSIFGIFCSKKIFLAKFFSCKKKFFAKIFFGENFFLWNFFFLVSFFGKIGSVTAEILRTLNFCGWWGGGNLQVINSCDIADMDKCCLDKCHHDSLNLVKMVPGTYF